MRANDLKNLTVADLLKKEKDLKKELFDLRFHQQMGQVEQPSRFRAIKKDIARILTVINEKENAQDGK